MVNPYAAAHSPRIHFTAHGRKPSPARLPGLEIVVWPRPPHRIWRCCFDGLFSN